MYNTPCQGMGADLIKLLIRNGLAEMVEGEILRYRTTAKGEEVLRHFEEIELLIPEMEAQE